MNTHGTMEEKKIKDEGTGKLLSSVAKQDNEARAAGFTGELTIKVTYARGGITRKEFGKLWTEK